MGEAMDTRHGHWFWEALSAGPSEGPRSGCAAAPLVFR